MSDFEYIANLVRSIPERPGVYQYLNAEGEIIYIGKAKNLHKRISSYFQKEHTNSKTRQLVTHIADIRYTVVNTEQDAFLLENNLIKKYKPHYNILLKDGKSYPSICITKEQYPRIYKTRHINKKIGEYYGPYGFGNTVDLVIELIHKLFPIRTCNIPINSNSRQKGKYKVCLKYHLHNCCGICEMKPESAQYSDWIAQARKIIRGDGYEISKLLEEEMISLSSEMRYEEANQTKHKLELLQQFQSKTIITNSSVGEVDVFGYDEQDDNIYISMLHVHKGSIIQCQTIEYKKKIDEAKEEILALGIVELREQLCSNTKDIIVPFIPDIFDEKVHIYIAIGGDRKKLLDLAMQNVQQYKFDKLKQADKLNSQQRTTKVLYELQKILQLPTLPIWIDSFDNSHIQGQNAVGGCVVYKMGKPSKKDYKKFEIKRAEGADDYASMREVVLRRYKHLIEEDNQLPDLIIADGGIGQMHAIREVIEEQLGLKIPIVGLKKNDKHKTQTLLYGFPQKKIDMPITSGVFRLMSQIQEEVHRFAISYHKTKRSKRQIDSQLDEIQGVGEITKQKILQHFGSVKRASIANLDEWQKLLGNIRGSKLYDYFQTKISR